MLTGMMVDVAKVGSGVIAGMWLGMLVLSEIWTEEDE